MQDEYRLAWANIEGWTTNAKSRSNPPRDKRILFLVGERLTGATKRHFRSA